MALTFGYNGGAIYWDKKGIGWGNEIKNCYGHICCGAIPYVVGVNWEDGNDDRW